MSTMTGLVTTVQAQASRFLSHAAGRQDATFSLTGGSCAQGAAVAFTSLCEAVVSWQLIRHEGLRAKITRIMQMYKAKLVRCMSYLQNQNLARTGSQSHLCMAAICP